MKFSTILLLAFFLPSAQGIFCDLFGIGCPDAPDVCQTVASDCPPDANDPLTPAQICSAVTATCPPPTLPNICTTVSADCPPPTAQVQQLDCQTDEEFLQVQDGESNSFAFSKTCPAGYNLMACNCTPFGTPDPATSSFSGVLASAPQRCGCNYRNDSGSVRSFFLTAQCCRVVLS